MIICKMTLKKFIYISLFAIIIFLPGGAYAQDSFKIYKPVPVKNFFCKIDKNIFNCFKYNYGLNYLAAGVTTICLIEGNVDWNWYRYTYSYKSLYNTGYSSVYIGEIVPFAVPLGLYFYGRSKENTDLQITGLALGQSALLSFSIAALLKTFTGRVPPTNLTDADDVNGDFRFGFLQGGINNGWPSSHTTIAFAMATTLIELYPDNLAIEIGSITYASMIGLGVSANVHWFSDVVSGALIGYTIGKTVGISYRKLMNHDEKKQAYNFYFTPNGIGFNYRFK